MELKYNPENHHRKSIRLKGYDYSSSGAYFITICTQNIECLFGNTVAKIIEEKWWNKLEEEFDDVKLDEFVIMPDHFHGIIILMQDEFNRRGRSMYLPGDCEMTQMTNENRRGRSMYLPNNCEEKQTSNKNQGEYMDSPLRKIPNMMQWFKKMSTNEYIREVKSGVLPPFNKLIWQRNYYDEIIRNEKQLNETRKYIINNPIEWELEHGGWDDISNL